MDGVWGYTYDAEGNETRKVKAATGESWTYGYDNANHLVLAEHRATASGSVDEREEYRYDAWGNRVQVTHDDGDGDGSGAVRLFDHRVLARVIQSRQDYNGQPIRLISCDTGQLPNGLAQNLSNKLGVDVLAPDAWVWPAPPNGLPIIAATPSGQIVPYQPGAGTITVSSPASVPGLGFTVPIYPPSGQLVELPHGWWTRS